MLAVVVGDQLSKWWIINSFSYLETKPVIAGFFNLTFVLNTGAAFGFLAGEHALWRQLFFIAVALIALVVLYFAFLHYRHRGAWFVYGTGLVAGGAVGNLVDRIRLGAVIDFLDFYVQSYHWPAFNVADSAITTGVSLFLLGSFLTPAEEEAGDNRKEDTDDR
ncbi:MAG: signal peptidase II [Proteobacteria bacterium]|nr:signal peptidase II [Pseudomonadota bacterium]MBU1711005.1 signal peptidase II [Pseudomonadota bacterium]